jgi:glutathione S-transferase
MSITLWGRRSAFNVQKVLWLLGELGLEFEHRNVGGSFGGLDTPEFRAMNPHGRIPVLCDGELVVWESQSILRYLAASYGGRALWAESPAERSQVDRWMDWSLATLQVDFMRLFWGWFRTPEDQRDEAANRAARKDCARHFRLLDAELAGRPYLAGAQLSLADVPAGTCLFRYFAMGLEVERPPHVDAWYARLAERPAYRASVMVPFDELRGRLAF